MPLPENFETPERFRESHFPYQVTTPDIDGWYLVPLEARGNNDQTIQHECWLINPNGTIANHPYQMTIVDLGL